VSQHPARTCGQQILLQFQPINREVIIVFLLINLFYFHLLCPWRILTNTSFRICLKNNSESARTRERQKIRSPCRNSTGGGLPRCAPSVAFALCGRSRSGECSSHRAQACAADLRHAPCARPLRRHINSASTTLVVR
jgi:hypothetical protein